MVDMSGIPTWTAQKPTWTEDKEEVPVSLVWVQEMHLEYSGIVVWEKKQRNLWPKYDFDVYSFITIGWWRPQTTSLTKCLSKEMDLKLTCGLNFILQLLQIRLWVSGDL